MKYIFILLLALITLQVNAQTKIIGSTTTAGVPSFLRSQHGVTTGSTDGSGDLTITFAAAMPDATYTILALPQGNSTYQLSGHTATTTSFKLRCSLGAGQNITIFYEIKDY